MLNYSIVNNERQVGLVKTGYKFVGWSLSKDGSSEVFDQDDTTVTSDRIYPDLKNKSTILTVKATAGRNGYMFRCIMTDADNNTITSDVAKLTVK